MVLGSAFQVPPPTAPVRNLLRAVHRVGFAQEALRPSAIGEFDSTYRERRRNGRHEISHLRARQRPFFNVNCRAFMRIAHKAWSRWRTARQGVQAIMRRGLGRAHQVPTARGQLCIERQTTHVGAALENLARLRLRGFGLSIDDYETGYSSMQQLTRIAFTELKIDQSFVKKAATQHSALVILESSLRMARQLRIASVAEGVETRADFDLLRSLQCDMAQGCFIAPPMEASAPSTIT